MKITIIIPFYNSYEYLIELKDSLIIQTRYPDEIIFIDDFSLRPLNDYDLLGLKNFKIIRNKKNMGPSISRNIGIEKASSEILIFTDSDCFLTPDWVEKNISYFNDPKINIVAGEAVVYAKEGLKYLISLLGYPAGGNLGFEKMWNVASNSTTNHLSSCNFAARKSVLTRKNLFFSPEFPFACCEDTYLSLVCSQKNEPIYFFKNNHVFHQPVKGLKHFLKWHFIRGRSSYYLQKRNISLFSFVSLRFRSLLATLNMSKNIFSSATLLTLFCTQVYMQAFGNIYERLRKVV